MKNAILPIILLLTITTLYSCTPPPNITAADAPLPGITATTDMSGGIYPYVGALSGGYAPLYGFCDGEGNIIFDPFYNMVYFIGKDGAGLYLARRLNGSERDEIDTVYIGADGSWVAQYEQAYYGCSDNSGIYYDYITAKKDGNWGVIDLDGTEVLPFTYRQPLLFIDGRAPIISDDLKTYTYMNIKGEIVTDPAEIPDNRFLPNGESTLQDDWLYRPILNCAPESPAPYSIEFDSAKNTIIATNGQKTHTFKNAAECEFLPDGNFLLRSYDYNPHEGTWRIETFDGKIIAPETDGYPLLQGNHIMANKKLFDLTGRQIGTGQYQKAIGYNGYFAVIQGRYGGLIDKGGNWIIKVSLLDYLDD